MKKVLLAAALIAAVLVPAASGSSSHRVKLSLVVLPKAALGAAGRSLALARGSGAVSDADASNNSIAGSAGTFFKLGRVTGYSLIFGDRYSGRSGITEITTDVDEYRTAADAKRGLAFWRHDDPKFAVLDPYGLPVTEKALKPPNVGTSRFAEATMIAAPSAARLVLVDEQFTAGRYVLQAKVAAASLGTAAAVAGKLARTLEHRLQLAEAGRLRGKPVKLPRPLKAGPPAGGPDLSTLALTTADFGGQATVTAQGYTTPSVPGLSEYLEIMEPAGSFDALQQLIDWYPTANDATVISRFEGALLAYVFDQPIGQVETTGPFTLVDLSSVGDNAYGGTWSVSPQGEPTQYDAVVALSSGRASDIVLFASQSPLQASDVLNLAQLVANRLNAGLSG